MHFFHFLTSHPLFKDVETMTIRKRTISSSKSTHPFWSLSHLSLRQQGDGPAFTSAVSWFSICNIGVVNEKTLGNEVRLIHISINHTAHSLLGCVLMAHHPTEKDQPCIGCCVPIGMQPTDFCDWKNTFKHYPKPQYFHKFITFACSSGRNTSCSMGQKSCVLST